MPIRPYKIAQSASLRILNWVVINLHFGLFWFKSPYFKQNGKHLVVLFLKIEWC